MANWHYFDPMPASYGSFPSWCDGAQVPLYNNGYNAGNDWSRNQTLDDRQSRPVCAMPITKQGFPSNPTTPQRLQGEFPSWPNPALSPPTPPAPSPHSHLAPNGPRHPFPGKQMIQMAPPHLANSNGHIESAKRTNGQAYTKVDESLSRDKPSKKDKTTMMLRNIPNKYTQKMLLKYLDSYGFRAKFDFFYLPIDFRNRCNVGYAFINFIAPEHAERFLKTLNRVKLPAYNSSKVCEVTYAHVQGLEENIEHYRNSPVNGVPIAAYRPLIFKGGLEIGFPKPDAPLPPIQLRPAKC